MKNSKVLKSITAVAVTVLFMMLMTANVFAGTTYIIKDGAFQNSGFINAGEAKDGTIQGPGNWTQLNLGDAAVDAPYLHVILKAEGGETAAAQIGVSDLFTFNLSDLGVTLSGDYQDVVLPVQDKGIMMLSWLNCMGLDGGTVTYTVKDVFLSDDASSTLTAPEASEAAPAEPAVTEAADATVPKTGSNQTVAITLLICMAGCALGLVSVKKLKKVF